MRKWLKRLVLLVVLAVLGVALAWQAYSPWLTEYARSRIEREVAHALNEPVVLGSLSIRLTSLNIEAEDFAVGESGEIIRFDELRLRVLPWSSLKQLRPVAEAAVAGAFVDVTKLVKESEGDESGGVPVFPFRIRDLRLTGARVIVPAGDWPVDLSATSLKASGGLSPISRRWSLQVDGDLNVRRGEEELRLDELHLKGAEASDGWVVQRLDLVGEGVEGAARLVGRNPPRHHVTAKMGLQRLRLIDPGLDWFSGDLAATAELSGSLADPDGTADVGIRGLIVGGYGLGDVDGKLARKADVIEVSTARLHDVGGEVEMSGQITLSNAQPVEFAVDWRDVDVARFTGLFTDRPAIAFTSTGSLDGSGTLEPLSGSAKASGSMSRAGVSPVEWTLDGRYAGGAGRMQIGATQAPGNTVRGDVAVASDESLEGDLTVRLADVAALAELAGRAGHLPFAGALNASATVAGSWQSPVVDGALEASRLHVYGEPVGNVRGKFFVDRERVRSDDLVMDFGDGELRASGTFGLAAQTTNDWRATARNVRIDRLAGLVRSITGVVVPVSKGRVSAQAEGRGPWSQVEASGNLQARELELAGEPFESLAVEMEASWPTWDVEATVVHAPKERLEARVSGRGIEEIADSSVHSSTWSLDQLQLGESAEVQGQVRVEGTLRGKIGALGGQLNASGRNIVWSGHKLGDIVVDGQGKVGKWQVKSALLRDTIHLVGGLDSGDGEFQLEANWSEAELAPLLYDDPGVQIASSGTMRLAGELQNPRRLDGEARISRLSIRSGGLQIGAQEPIRISADEGRFAIESLTLAGNGTVLTLTGNATTSGELHVRGEGSGNLQLFELIGEPIQSLEGHFELAVDADRQVGQPIELSGTVSVSNAALDVGLPIGMTDTNGELVLQGSRVRITRLEGEIGGGTFSVGGGVDVRGGPDIEWRLVDVSGSLVPSLEQELSGHGTLRGAWDDVTVSGEVEILRMLYDRDIEPSDFVPSFKRRLTAPAQKASSNVIRLDLHVHAPDDLYIDNNFARVEAMTDLQVKGTTKHPNLRGRIDVLNGEVFFRDRTFDIVTGVVDFRPQRELIGDLNITAETVVETVDASYGITVQISGTTDDPKVVLSADDPGLTQTDIVSLITFGKTVAQLQEGSGGSSMDALIGFVTGRAAKQVESEAETLLPVDRVEIEPAFSTTGAFEPQVKVSKDFSDDLTASVATTLGVDLQRTLDLEYRLTDRTSLLGTWESESEGQAGAIGGGVKFRREFRRIPGFSLLGTTGK